ncbi:MAG: amidase [Actinobacteria bacterium]|nr:amidase [Actinomycetota bacterium]
MSGPGAGSSAAGWSINAIARAYRTGQLSPVDVTETCLQRIEQVDAEIGAFATVVAERARADARTAVSEVRRDRDMRRPLLGIPMGVKDIVDVAGVPTGAGCPAATVPDAAADATLWRRLADAGAVLIGKTSTHELAYGVATPFTRNPHDTTRMPGGSSGGSAAALVANMCVGAVGTDTAGSIRIPAGLCGVVGCKPTRGLVPTDGILALAPTLDQPGPMARYVTDLLPLLAAMTDLPMAPELIEVPGLRVGLATNGALWSRDVRAAFDSAAGALADAGARVSEVDVPSFADAVWYADRIIGVEAGVVHAKLLATAGDDLSETTRAKLESATRVDGPTYYRALRHAASVRDGLDAALDDTDVLLAPGVATTAPEHGATSVDIDGTTHRLSRALCWNTAALNMAGLPTVALPAGAGDDGLPVGVQLIARAGTDARLLSTAAAVASLFGDA